MSGIVGSRLNIRGSGLVGSLGTDGQVMTSAGAGKSAVYEDAAGGGLEMQSVVTASSFTAVAGNSYPVNTTSNACTVTLPASASAGDELIFTDYARKWATNALTVAPNSLNFQGASSPNPVYNTDGQSVHLLYQDATKGWIPITDDVPTWETYTTYNIDFLAVGGGGGGGSGCNVSTKRSGGGGGGGGYRNSYAGEPSGGNSASETPITAIAKGVVLAVVIGCGGAAGAGGTAGTSGTVGVDTTITPDGGEFTTITSDGGGGGGRGQFDGGDGGSGGGGGATGRSGGSATSDQGYDGGDSTNDRGGGGGGAGSIGIAGGSSTDDYPNGGAGLTSTISGPGVPRAGGGGGGTDTSAASPIVNGTAAASYGTHGGGHGSYTSVTYADSVADVNTGGGGGGGGENSGSNNAGGAGGSGVVVLRMADENYSGTTSGSPTIIPNADSSGETVLIFNANGSYTT